MRLLKEPLFHFFLIGAAIFIWFQIVAPEDETVETTETITITENDIAQLSNIARPVIGLKSSHRLFGNFWRRKALIA